MYNRRYECSFIVCQSQKIVDYNGYDQGRLCLQNLAGLLFLKLDARSSAYFPSVACCFTIIKVKIWLPVKYRCSLPALSIIFYSSAAMSVSSIYRPNIFNILLGSREQINKCLRLIRRKFPPSRFPDLKLTPLLPPPIVSPRTPVCDSIIRVKIENYFCHVFADRWFENLFFTVESAARN